MYLGQLMILVLEAAHYAHALFVTGVAINVSVGTGGGWLAAVALSNNVWRFVAIGHGQIHVRWKSAVGILYQHDQLPADLFNAGHFEAKPFLLGIQ
jgi:hypothetical protein